MKPWKYERGDVVTDLAFNKHYRITRRLRDVDTDVRFYLLQAATDDHSVRRNAKLIESHHFIKQGD